MMEKDGAGARRGEMVADSGSLSGGRSCRTRGTSAPRGHDDEQLVGGEEDEELVSLLLGH